MSRRISVYFIIFNIIITTHLIGVVWGNKIPLEPPAGDPGGRKMRSESGEFAHEKFVRIGCSKLLLASNLVREFCSKYELGESDLGILIKAEPLFDEAADNFDLASKIVKSCVPGQISSMFLNYKYYDQFVFNPSYDGHIMLDVCNYLRKANFSGFHGRCAQILREMKSAAVNVRINTTPESVMALYKAIQNPFGHYGTVVCAKVVKGN